MKSKLNLNANTIEGIMRGIGFSIAQEVYFKVLSKIYETDMEDTICIHQQLIARKLFKEAM